MTQVDALAARVENLEKSMMRWKRAALVLGVAVMVVGTVAASQQEKIPDVIKAGQFHAVDKDGRVRVELSAAARIGMRVMNERGRLVATVSHGSDGTGWVSLKTSRSRSEASLSPADVRGGGLRLTNASGRTVAQLATTSSGGGQVELKNARGRDGIVAGVRNGSGAIRLGSEHGWVAMSLGVDQDGGRVRVNSKTGETVAAMQVSGHGHGIVGAWDREGKGRVLNPGQ